MADETVDEQSQGEVEPGVPVAAGQLLGVTAGVREGLGRGFVVGLVITGAFFAAFTAFQLAFNLLLQLGLHWTPLRAGFALIPWALGTTVGMGLAGAVLVAKLGRATVHLGLVIGVAGLLGLARTVAQDQGALTIWSATPSLLGIGFGSGLVFIPIFD